MSLDHAILGFLNYQPLSGYDLKRVFDATIRHFWPADQSQIYRTLARLTEQGCVQMGRVGQAKRPDRKVYHITKAGQEELARWMAAPPPTGTTRRPGLVQVFFIGQLSDREILAKFESYAAGVRQTLKAYERVPATLDEYAGEMGSAREAFFWLSTLDLGKRAMRTNLEWAEQMISQIRKRKVPSKQTAGARARRARPKRVGKR